MSVEVRIAGLVTDDRDRRVVLLDEAGRRALPVWVWWESYWSIDKALRKFPLRQPTLSQFVTRLLEATGATLERVTITKYLHIDLYASAALRKDGVAWEMDIGPSDALALAAWEGCPIYVAEAVMDMFAVPVQGPAFDGARPGRLLDDAALAQIVKDADAARVAMERCTMAVDEVVEGIYIGGAPAVDHADALRAAGVTRVLKLSTVEQAWPDDFVVFDNALNDSEFVPLDTLQRGVAFVRAQREAGHSVLIACHAGVSRSSTFVMAYLMDALGYDLREAWARLSAQHGAAWPMPQMWESLLTHFDHGYRMEDVHAWLEAARP